MLGLATLRANPLLRLELRKPDTITAALMMFRSAALCAISIFVGIIILLFNRNDGWLRLVFGVWCLVTLSVPSFLALSTAQIAQRKLATEDFDLVRVSPLSNRQLVQWLIVLGMQHTRNLIRMVIGITPILILAATGLDVYQNFINCLVGYRGSLAVCDNVTQISWFTFGTLSHYALMFINVWLGMLTAAMLGLTLSLWSRGSYIAHYFAAFAIIIGFGIGLMLIVGRPLQEAFSNNVQLLLSQIVVIGGCYFAASAGIRRSS